MNTFDPIKHEYAISGRAVPSVTQVLQRAGLIDDSWFTEDSRERGTFVHEATALFDRGELDFDRLDPALVGYVEAWQMFRALVPVKFDLIEVPMWSEEYRFAGTIDRAWPGHVLDIKTGAFPAWMPLQLGGYSILYPAQHACGVRLGSDGKFSMWNIAPYELAMARKDFLAAL